MQTIKYLILFSILFFYFSDITAQQKNRINKTMPNSKPVPQEVSSYFNFLRGYKSKIDIKADMDTISTNRLKKIAKMMYLSSEKDAEVTAEIEYNQCKVADSLAIQKWKYHKNVKTFAKPTLTEKFLYKKIRAKLSKKVFAVVFSDYLLKVTIKSIKKVRKAHQNYSTGFTEPPQTKIEIDASVDDVIKGRTRFSPGDVITFYYMPWWKAGYNFKVGEIDFVPLWAVVDPDYRENEIGLITTFDSSQGRYPIINGELIDKSNYFGYGKNVPWGDFRYNLVQLIKTIKSW